MTCATKIQVEVEYENRQNKNKQKTVASTQQNVMGRQHFKEVGRLIPNKQFFNSGMM